MSRQQVSAELCLSFASSGDTQLHHEDVAEMNRSEPGEGRAHQLHVPKVIGASRLLSDNMVFSQRIGLSMLWRNWLSGASPVLQ